jgi:hypothetical protein
LRIVAAAVGTRTEQQQALIRTSDFQRKARITKTSKRNGARQIRIKMILKHSGLDALDIELGKGLRSSGGCTKYSVRVRNGTQRRSLGYFVAQSPIKCWQRDSQSDSQLAIKMKILSLTRHGLNIGHQRHSVCNHHA